jgi:hypothetical protein
MTGSWYGLSLWALLLTLLVAGCAAPQSRYKKESDDLFISLRGSEAAALFPVEFRDIYLTLHRGDDQLSQEHVDTADSYYRLAIGKVALLKEQYGAEMKRREEMVRLERERLAREAEERRRLQALERERAEEAARAAARAKKLEEEKSEARKRVERRPEPPQVAAHTVKRGETLPQIAALGEVYGDSALWPLIYRANRDQISNPAVLWPGQVLRIPRNVDRNDISEARRFSADRLLR